MLRSRYAAGAPPVPPRLCRYVDDLTPPKPISPKTHETGAVEDSVAVSYEIPLNAGQLQTLFLELRTWQIATLVYA